MCPGDLLDCWLWRISPGCRATMPFSFCTPFCGPRAHAHRWGVTRRACHGRGQRPWARGPWQAVRGLASGREGGGRAPCIVCSRSVVQQSRERTSAHRRRRGLKGARVPHSASRRRGAMPGGSAPFHPRSVAHALQGISFLRFFPGCVPHSQLHSADAWRPGSSASCACAHSSVSTPGVSGRRTTLRGRSTARPDEWQLPRPTGRHCWHHWHSMRTGTTATGSFRSGSAGLPRKWTRWGEGGQANSTALDPAGR